MWGGNGGTGQPGAGSATFTWAVSTAAAMVAGETLLPRRVLTGTTCSATREAGPNSDRGVSPGHFLP